MWASVSRAIESLPQKLCKRGTDSRVCVAVSKALDYLKFRWDYVNKEKVLIRGLHVKLCRDSNQRQGSGNTMAAIPLCIPNNCSWDETSGAFQRDSSQPRTGLQPVNPALRKLRSIGGPVCVVSIAGPCRRGKSYILSRAFDQGDVFPLGHSFDPETMGIWLWVVPEKYRDAQGREFTVVLLDSEGIDAVSAEGINDHAIFTLSVLLSSVLIYNSVGVPTRTDLEGLEYPFRLYYVLICSWVCSCYLLYVSIYLSIISITRCLRSIKACAISKSYI